MCHRLAAASHRNEKDLPILVRRTEENLPCSQNTRNTGNHQALIAERAAAIIAVTLNSWLASASA